ncbi:16S rRNA (guanine(966)-N(2))-methyltransferase RsmD [Oceanicoccus sp. KOV_DT_Chl]|uniref:16S rRNA (guanine(966)-N(2))-methyltransferase RsmD n=1 Tax=Oceanicoccus sp. KOV_DT_Chl TaxID=1904639 RepID=UPI000C7D3671|nr:16S rRNA (guanine(966)-N(2))-methyltransferase RsmD [Oceanicoccus sp. KOV_DT_Chl]
MAKTSPRRPSNKTSNQLRIIGGQWRGRKLAFPTVEGLRPTPDRVRETLFNWLAPSIIGARCADLFSGSGALGLEALSRGSGHTDLVDSAKPVSQQLNLNLQTLQCDHATVWHSQAQPWLQQAIPGYDIIFLDPPFGQNLAASCIEIINNRNLLNDKAWVYLEMGATEPLPHYPENWQLHREKTAGQVCYRLFKVEQA